MTTSSSDPSKERERSARSSYENSGELNREKSTSSGPEC